jgi:hypothetical protein
MSARGLVRPATVPVLLLGACLLASLHCATDRRVQETIQVKVYFGKTERDVCNCDAPVVREIPRTGEIERTARLALREMIEGPNDEEYAAGYRMCLPSAGTVERYRETYTKIVEAYREQDGSMDHFGRKFLSPEGEFTPWGDRVRVRGVRIVDGTAYPDFSKELYSYGGGSCFTEAIETSIVNTLSQFPQVEKVVILIEGREAEIEP